MATLRTGTWPMRLEVAVVQRLIRMNLFVGTITSGSCREVVP